MKKLKNICRYTSIMLVAAMLNISVISPAYAAEVTAAADVTGAAAEVTEPAAVTEAAEEAAAVDLNGTYHATLGIQTCNMLWVGRWGYFDAEINPAFGTDKNAILFSGSETSGNYVEYAGTFTDATIEGNGTYTISLTGADLAGETTISQLHIATDIPLSDQIKFTDVAVKINGRTVMTFTDGYVETDPKFMAGGIVILAANHWRAPLVKLLTDNGNSENNGGLEWVSGSGNDNIEIKFTVSGFAYDKVEPTAAATIAPTAAASGSDSSDAEPATETSAQSEGSTGNSWVIIAVIIGAVVVVGGAAAVVVLKKKKSK